MTSTTHSILTLHLVMHGRVQGVFFRDSMRKEAQQLGITGWVRNCNNGTVEALIQGTQTAVDQMVQWAHHGPSQARVDKVEIEPATGSFARFDIQY